MLMIMYVSATQILLLVVKQAKQRMRRCSGLVVLITEPFVTYNP